MLQIDADALKNALPYGALVDALDDAFKGGMTVPLRTHHTLPVVEGSDGTLLMMPAWSDAGFLGIKTAIVAPDNATFNLPAVQATYQLFDRWTGQPLALLDGQELTARRTAAASALASRYLSAPDASKLLMIGTGVLSRYLPSAHAAVRPISEVKIWGRDPEKAAAAANDLRAVGLRAEPVDDVSDGLAWADIVTSATLSKTPLIMGTELRPGQHVDLVGGFRPDMREADDAAIMRARLFCDTRAGALSEAGDLCDPLARGIITESDVEADLFDLAQGSVKATRTAKDITLFKSAGTAIEDLAAAALAYSRNRE